MAGGMGPMAPSATIMLVVGVAVLVHGAVLLTPTAERFGRVSGPAMLLWSVVMLANQALVAAVPGWTMDRPMMGSGSMTWDGGMVAIAVLMLISGLIMTRQRDMS
ncbi:MAG: hypothetical protein ABR593_09020 [Candidatus Limnocylindria bacterium]